MAVEEGLLDDKGEGEGDGQDGGDDESEDDLGIVSSLTLKWFGCSFELRHDVKWRGMIFRKVHV